MDAFKTGALPILQRILLLATDAQMEIKKRGMEPDGGGEIYFSCEPVKFTKAIQVCDKYIFLYGNFLIIHPLFVCS